MTELNESFGVKVRLACPLRPPQATKMPSPELARAIEKVAQNDSSLVSRALNSYASRLERGGFVRFQCTTELDSADRYIRFLRDLGLRKLDIELVSGDSDSASPYIRWWKEHLTELYLRIVPCPDSQTFGAKKNLSIRPRSGGPLRISHAGFRFAMAMAYVVFGPS